MAQLKIVWDKLWAQKLPLVLIIFFLTLTPVLAYLVSVRFQAQDFLNLQKLLQQNGVNLPQTTAISSLDELRKNLEQKFTNSKNSGQSSNNYSGPTLQFRLAIEGRTNDQSTRLFVGIAPGQVTNNPSYILSFLIDVPASGEYSGVSLTGLDIGSPYTAYFKGSSQIVKALPFTSQPLINDLGRVELLSGDLNEDNVIDNSDLEIERKLIGKTPTSPDWNKYADFNQDGVINNIDLTYINKNLGKIGDSGTWISSPLKRATTLGISTSSGRLIVPVGEHSQDASSSGGYWLWIPRF